MTYSTLLSLTRLLFTRSIQVDGEDNTNYHSCLLFLLRSPLHHQRLWNCSSNQKNNRPVCAADEAGYVQYEGLPGKVKTGCMNTPLQTSTFCAHHYPRVMEAQCSDEPKQKIQYRVVESILQEKQTRNGCYYQVGNVFCP